MDNSKSKTSRKTWKCFECDPTEPCELLFASFGNSDIEATDCPFDNGRVQSKWEVQKGENENID